MKILVFDDNATHRAAAEAQLKGHDLTVVGTYDEAQKLLADGSSFNVVLCDLLVPASQQHQGSREHVGKEMPVGIFIALLAAVKGGAKYVAVFTDSDHHSHPASACFDAFNEYAVDPTPFMVEGSKVLLSNCRNWVGTFAQDDLSRELKYAELKDRSDTIRAKNWVEVLDHLIKQ